MIRCCAKNCSSVTPRCGQFFAIFAVLQHVASFWKRFKNLQQHCANSEQIGQCNMSSIFVAMMTRILRAHQGGNLGRGWSIPYFPVFWVPKERVWSYFVSWCVFLWPTWLRDILQEWLQGLFCFLLDLYVSNNLLSTSWWTELYSSNGSITTFVGRLPRLFLEIHLKTLAIQLQCVVCNTSCAGEIKLLIACSDNSFAWTLGSPPLCDSCYRFTLSINKKSMVLDTTTYVFQWL